MGQLVLFTILYVFTSHVAPNFGSDPHFSKKEDCCKFPSPKWNKYETECLKYKNAFNKYDNTCAMDCIFNVSQVLQKDELNMVNARNLVSNLYNGNPDFIQAFNNALEKCQTQIKLKMDQLKAAEGKPHGSNDTFNCRPLPMLYVLCTVREVFTNCPASAWTSSTECENIKNYDHDGMHG